MPEYTYSALVTVRAGNEDEAKERLDEAQGVLKRLTTATLNVKPENLILTSEERGTPEGRTDG